MAGFLINTGHWAPRCIDLPTLSLDYTYQTISSFCNYSIAKTDGKLCVVDNDRLIMVTEDYATETVSPPTPFNKSIKASSSAFVGIKTFDGKVVFPTTRPSDTSQGGVSLYAFDGTAWSTIVSYGADTNGVMDMFELDGLLFVIAPEFYNRYDTSYNLIDSITGFPKRKGSFYNGERYGTNYTANHRLIKNVPGAWVVVDDNHEYYFHVVYDNKIYLLDNNVANIYTYDGTGISQKTNRPDVFVSSKRSELYNHNEFFYFVDNDRVLWQFRNKNRHICKIHEFAANEDLFGFILNTAGDLLIHATKSGTFGKIYKVNYPT